MTCQVLSPPSSANVRIVTAVNATFQDAFQFDDEDVTSWDFNNKTFTMGIKRDFEDAAQLISLTSVDGTIVVDDALARILHFNVPPVVLAAAQIVVGDYIYDLLMTDFITAVVTPIMHGDFIMTDGVTGVV